MTVLQWIVQFVHPTCATGWTTARAAIGNGSIMTYNGYETSERAGAVKSGPEPDREVSEQEQEADDRHDSDDQRTGEQRTEQPGVVLEVHVVHHDDRELHGRHDQEARHEQLRSDERRDVIDPHLDSGDHREDQRHPFVLLPRRVSVCVVSWRVCCVAVCARRGRRTVTTLCPVWSRILVRHERLLTG